MKNINDIKSLILILEPDKKWKYKMEEEQSWSDFTTLPDFLIENLESNDFKSPFPVQTAVISHFFSTNNDLAIGFPTGSGKTLSYLIPLISKLCNRVVQKLRALIVVPNRELAIQVFNTASLLIKGSKIAMGILSTNYFVGNKKESPDILIATALGLSSYLVEQDEKLLCNVEHIILDEGDAILEQPLENWLDHVNNSLMSSSLPEKFCVPIETAPPKNRKIRKILCSATLSRNSKQSEDFQMDSPLLLVASDKSRYVVPLGITEEFSIMERSHKPAVLLAYTKRFKFLLCFVSTSKRCVSLASIMRKLNPELNVIEFAAAASFTQKQKALDSAENSQSRLIIATDSLARGVDLPFLDAVVNFDVPTSTRTYVHRMGRTARGKNTGVCITMLLENELVLFRDIVTKIDGSAPVQNNINLRGDINKFYNDVTKGFDNLKVRKAPNTKKIAEDETDTE